MIKSAISFKPGTGALIAAQVVLLASISNGLAQESAVKSQPSSQGTTVPEVRVNGRVLTASQVTQLECLYHVRPIPGSYWYDAMSGLYGVAGGPALGLMYPGHNLGLMAEDASAGDTLVYVNHRRIPMSEWFVWSAIVGVPVRPGRYWLDARGNVGYEGVPIRILNLQEVASRRAQSQGASRPRKSVLTSWDLTGVAVFGSR